LIVSSASGTNEPVNATLSNIAVPSVSLSAETTAPVITTPDDLTATNTVDLLKTSGETGGNFASPTTPKLVSLESETAASNAGVTAPPAPIGHEIILPVEHTLGAKRSSDKNFNIQGFAPPPHKKAKEFKDDAVMVTRSRVAVVAS
jgi:hypothetical protein